MDTARCLLRSDNTMRRRGRAEEPIGRLGFVVMVPINPFRLTPTTKGLPNDAKSPVRFDQTLNYAASFFPKPMPGIEQDVGWVDAKILGGF